MNIANKVTVSRFVLTILFIILGSIDTVEFRWAAWTAGLFACVSDFFDGYLARKYGLVSDFGKLMDPLADKIFITAAFFILVENSVVPGWAAVLIMAREFAVTGLRQLAAQKGLVIEAAMGGKIKTVLQFVYLGLSGVVWGIYGSAGLGGLESLPLYYSLYALMIATVIITVYTGYEYFIKNKALYTGTI